MPKTHALLVDHGASFSHAYVNTPVCCPSRSQTLTGRYAHNLRDAAPFHPAPPGRMCGDEPVEAPSHPCGCMRMNCSAAFEAENYATYVQRAGYHTGYFGKYLNPPAIARYCAGTDSGNSSTPPGSGLPNGFPPGWDELFIMCDQASGKYGGYYDVNWIDNSDGGHIAYTGMDPHHYTTSLIGNKTVAYIEARARDSATQPFLVVAATRAPHRPSVPAPWYSDVPFQAPAPRTPAWNVTPPGAAPWYKLNPPLTDADAASLDALYRDRLRSILSIDDLVEGVIGALDAGGLLDATFIVYTSDHGFHLGEMRLAPGKEHFYEFDARVPFVVRGPGVAAAGTVVTAPVGNVDLAPTFLSLAGVTPPPHMDGRSLLPLLTPAGAADAKWRDAFLLEHFAFTGWPAHFGPDVRMNSNPNNTYRALRFVNASHDWTYAESTDALVDYAFDDPAFYELYDHASDPYQLRNIWPGASDALKAELHGRMVAAFHCVGASCA